MEQAGKVPATKILAIRGVDNRVEICMVRSNGCRLRDMVANGANSNACLNDRDVYSCHSARAKAALARYVDSSRMQFRQLDVSDK